MAQEINQSIKNTSLKLLESFRRHPVTEEDVQYIRGTQQYTSSDKFIIHEVMAKWNRKSN